MHAKRTHCDASLKLESAPSNHFCARGFHQRAAAVSDLYSGRKYGDRFRLNMNTRTLLTFPSSDTYQMLCVSY